MGDSDHASEDVRTSEDGVKAAQKGFWVMRNYQCVICQSIYNTLCRNKGRLTETKGRKLRRLYASLESGKETGPAKQGGMRHGELSLEENKN